ncbi:MAG: Gfo/Idh/MocA family oxidoreductase, partial [Cytophagales bacterium]|nr:Gfo/Idh/MocA family oxidoreductase [Armatimonadota bacterium]
MTVPQPKPVSFGIVGLGSAGLLHAKVLSEGRIPGARLTAVVGSPSRFQEVTPFFPAGVRRFDSLQALLSANVSEAVIIATPHPLHPQQTMIALAGGCHVFCEKPAAIRSREAREMAEMAQRHNRVYALNYNRRTAPLYQRLHALVRSGEIGELRRVNWTSTSWLRVQSYYDSSSWRGTWAGEGGGLLVNQWPHILDLWQWVCGMPTRLQATCRFGGYHNIEVEDEVHVFAEYENGATVFLTGSTGEAPGSERIEMVGSQGRIIA